MTDERKAELKDSIRIMHDASHMFYRLAIHAGCHAFIELTGLINEYIRICEDALEKGIDFTAANVHTGYHLPILPYRADYLTEKLQCIYGKTASVRPTAPKAGK